MKIHQKLSENRKQHEKSIFLKLSETFILDTINTKLFEKFHFFGRKNILRFPVLFMQFEIPRVIHAIRALRVTKFELSTNGVFFPTRSSGFGVRYWLQSQFIYSLVCRNTCGDMISSLFIILARFSAHGGSQKRSISLF